MIDLEKLNAPPIGVVISAYAAQVFAEPTYKLFTQAVCFQRNQDNTSEYLTNYMKNTRHQEALMRSFYKCLLFAGSFFLTSTTLGNHPNPPIEITIAPNQPGLITSIIQMAIDSCGANGGGVVFFPAGKYLTGTIELKNKVSLLTEKGTLIVGSSRYADYKNDAFIFGENLTGIAILGEGVINGVDCNNPDGEEGFRGPHCIRLINCKNISVKEISIKNSANWAMNFRHCSNASIKNVSIRGGHDGLHTRFCNNFTVTGCDFRTGDDAFAGNDNRNFLVTDCKINTSCNGFRIGCYNFIVKRCKLWGPGEYIHKIAKRRNMLTAFVHFSPKDENPKLQSGNWLLEDITVINVDNFYRYNYANGLWQTGQPVTTLQIKDIKATGLLCAFNIIGDTARKFDLSIKNAVFSYREGVKNRADSFEGVKTVASIFFYAQNFNQIKLQQVSFQQKGGSPVFNCTTGNSLILNHVTFITGQTAVPYLIRYVNKTMKDGLPLSASRKIKK